MDESTSKTDAMFYEWNKKQEECSKKEEYSSALKKQKVIGLTDNYAVSLVIDWIKRDKHTTKARYSRQDSNTRVRSKINL